MNTVTVQTYTAGSKNTLIQQEYLNIVNFCGSVLFYLHIIYNIHVPVMLTGCTAHNKGLWCNRMIMICLIFCMYFLMRVTVTTGAVRLSDVE